MRIVYGLFSDGGVIRGGHKMILRHVETLRSLGFDAVATTGAANVVPGWFRHRAPILTEASIRPENDILVMPDDAADAVRPLAAKPYRMVLFVQGHFNHVAFGQEAVQSFPAGRPPIFMSVSPSVSGLLRRLYPEAQVEMVRGFADERRFRPGVERDLAVAAIARKRPFEAGVIRRLYGQLHPQHADLRWRWIEDAEESLVGQALGQAALFLSLGRLEGLGLTPLEAMASGAVCVGFTGIGGRDYATPENGYWVDEDDCLAAADALAEATALVKAGGAALDAKREAGFETARQWSYAAFREELEATWMRLAPDARLRNGPLD